MKTIFGIMLIMGAAAAAPPAQVSAQVTSSNYRQYANCAEVQVEGRWFNTYGEGRCLYSGQTAVNAEKLRSMDRGLAAMQQAQQSLLSLGRSIGRQQQAVSDERAETYSYRPLTGSGVASPESFYAQTKFFYPSAGTVVYAKPGEPVLTTSDGFLAPCFIALDAGEASSIGGHHHHVRAGELVCKLKAKDNAYTPLYSNYSFSGGEMSMGQTLELKDGKYKICYRNMGMNAMCVKNIPRDRVVETVGIVELKKTSRDVATFESATDGKLVAALRNAAPSENPLRTFDLNLSKSIEIDHVQFDVLEANERAVVLRRK